MTDIWSGIGVEVGKQEGEWLFRVNGEIRGPVPQRVLVDKIIKGEVAPDTPVALEGGEFHPVGQVKAFAPHVKIAIKNEQKRRRRKLTLIVAAVLLVVLGTGGAVGYFMYQEYQREQQAIAEAKRKEEERRQQLQRERQKAGNLQLVALVTLGSEEEVEIRDQPARRSKRQRRGRRPPSRASNSASAGSAAGSGPSVSSCERGTGDILGVLGRHVAKLNVCVVDEKKRDTSNSMPPSLQIEFVVRPDGKVVDFRINHRFYRKGTLNNCMIKAFNTIRFPPAQGSNCPITLPLKIGG